jgi:ADP-heptose:LPS heptosyltransferase
MAAILERIPSGARVAVIRLRSLGDCVLTTPALALLKAHRPDLEIAVVVEDRFAAVFEENPDIAGVLPSRKGPLFAWRPRMVINLHGGTRSMGLMIASRAPLRAGFAHHAWNFLYTHKIPRAQEILGEERSVHTAEHLASAMFSLGLPVQEIPRAKVFARPAPGPPRAVIHAFASRGDKAWPAEKFAGAAERLRRECGLEPVFLAGAADDPSPFARFRVLRNAPLTDVKSLIAGASLFVGNDSGPAHVAAALGVPVVALFGPSDPAIWAPWRCESQVLRSQGPIGSIPVEDVVAAAAALMVKA